VQISSRLVETPITDLGSSGIAHFAAIEDQTMRDEQRQSMKRPLAEIGQLVEHSGSNEALGEPGQCILRVGRIMAIASASRVLTAWLLKIRPDGWIPAQGDPGTGVTNAESQCPAQSPPVAAEILASDDRDGLALVSLSGVRPDDLIQELLEGKSYVDRFSARKVVVLLLDWIPEAQTPELFICKGVDAAMLGLIASQVSPGENAGARGEDGGRSAKSAPAMDRVTFVKALAGLGPPDFELFVATIPDAARHVSGHGTIPERVAQLIRWAESSTGRGIEPLQDAYRKLFLTRVSTKIARGQ
jgi:hypothetical protein